VTNKFKVLGCGHSESLEHYNNNALVVSQNGKMLIDCGYTIKHALSDQGMTIDDIDAIYISHVHGDHVFGLERFAYETKYKYNKKIKLVFHKSLYTELWEQTLKGSLGSNGEGDSSFDDYFELHQLDDYKFSMFGINYELLPVKHTPGKPCFGLLVNNYLLYSTDTTAIPDVIDRIKFTVGFHDVTLADENPVHATVNSLITQYSEETNKKLFLMSYEDNWQEHKEKIDRTFNGLAFQGQEVLIPNEDV